MKLSKKEINTFKTVIYDYYKIFGRPFSWRNTTNPYHIFVSEVMLQQTQTTRVRTKYEEFIALFPDFKTLANAPLYELLKAWQGLGYNRRALNLQKSAQIISEKYQGIVPSTPEELITLPGIGPATAASIAAFAYNKPTVFVETNIRVVFIHFFLNKKEKISDKEILSLVEQTLDKKNPRIWYYALMDYGVMLKAQGINPINKSKHYKKQSKFQGSDRQIRGAILKLLIKHQTIKNNEIITLLEKQLKATPERINKALNELTKENFIKKQKDDFSISK